MSTFTLKIIALLLMVIDHIGLYFPDTPILLRWIGRSSYPLFLFCMIWGYHYTKSRKRFLLRLYLMGLFMAFFTLAIDTYFAAPHEYGNHNIFVSMLLVGIVISTLELIQKNKKKGYLLLTGILCMQILYYLLPTFLPFLKSFSGDILTAFIPNLVLNEYGMEFVLLGALMYFLKDNKNLFSAMYILFCIAQFDVEMLSGGFIMQTFMLFALPLMLLYNHKKGYGMKYFFYFFYPAHTFLLFYISHSMLT